MLICIKKDVCFEAETCRHSTPHSEIDSCLTIPCGGTNSASCKKGALCVDEFIFIVKEKLKVKNVNLPKKKVMSSFIKVFPFRTSFRKE